MKKLFTITLLLITTAVYANEDFNIVNIIPAQFQGSYATDLLDAHDGQGYRHMTTTLCDVRDREFVINGRIQKPTAVHTLGDRELWVFFADLNRFWKIRKQRNGDCTVDIEDTKKQAIIQTWKAEIK